MSTRCNICIRLEKKDIGTVRVAVNEDWKGVTDIPINLGYVELSGKYAQIYVHHDGYLEGVGKVLIKEYSTYDEALNLVLGGDASSIVDDYCPYASFKYEDWETIKPDMYDEIPPCEEEYQYMFNLGYWWYRTPSDMTWKDLELSSLGWENS